MTKQKNIALFIDYENVAYHEFFDICVLTAKLKEKGRLIVQKAYADWALLFKKDLDHIYQMSNKAIELVELPVYNATRENSKNFGDIKLTVDALEVAFIKPFIDTFVIVSGDGDCSPLISKLREYNKEVIGVGRDNTNKLLPEYCDSFLYYKDLVRELFEEAIELCKATDTEPTINTIKKSITERLSPPFDYSERFRKLMNKAQQEGYIEVVDGLIKIGSGKKVILSKTNGRSIKKVKTSKSVKTTRSTNSSKNGATVVALKKPQRIEVKKIVTKNGTDLPKKVESAIAKTEGKPTKKDFNKELLKLVYWSFEISKRVAPNHKGFDSRLIENNIKRLDLSYQLNSYEPQYQKFDEYLNDLVKKCGYLKYVESKGNKNVFYALEPKFEKKGQELQRPENYVYAFTDSRFIKHKLTINFDSIYAAAKKITEIIIMEPNVPMNKIRNRMYKLKNGNRSFYTLLASGCFRNKEGTLFDSYQADGIIDSVDSDFLFPVKNFLNKRVPHIFSNDKEQEGAFDALTAISAELIKFELAQDEKQVKKKIFTKKRIKLAVKKEKEAV